ncbi:MAG: hypothetical protein ABFD14_01280 [Anaerolineaceae bacterium]
MTTTIALYHKHYNEKHLDEVKAAMQTLGTPAIRAIWSECYGLWLAVEGCHRIRAAKELGLIPEIVDISDDETALIQIDGDEVEMLVSDLAVDLTDSAPKTAIINFDDGDN